MKNKNIKMSSRNTHHSSSRSVSMRDIVVGVPNASLYPGLQISGMTSEAGGFTLIELLVVVLIIGILSAVALPQYNKAVEKARATEALSIIKAIANASMAYHMANGTYPQNIDELDIEILGTSITNYNVHRIQTKWFEYGTNRDAGDSNCLAIANRLPLSTFYYLNYFADNTICCYGASTKGDDFCKSFSKGKINAKYSDSVTCYQL